MSDYKYEDILGAYCKMLRFYEGEADREGLSLSHEKFHYMLAGARELLWHISSIDNEFATVRLVRDECDKCGGTHYREVDIRGIE